MGTALQKGVIGLWAVGVIAGFLVLTEYENGPGPRADAPSDWPAPAPIAPAATHTLVAFVHPHCPCTEATMGEMARLMRHVRGQVAVHVFFVQPRGFTDAWVRSGLWKKAEAIPGVTPHLDPEGRSARQFGAYTSGQVLLYDRDERLVFNGGITGSRGHEGNNKGRQAVTEWITTGQSDQSAAFVFGCLLMSEPQDVSGADTPSRSNQSL